MNKRKPDGSENNGYDNRTNKRQRHDKNGVLGIDIGSTYTRITIFCPPSDIDVDPEPLIYNIPHPGPVRSGVFKTGEWSSTGFPFSGGRVYTGAHVDGGRLGTSLKPGFVIASNLSLDEKLTQIRDYPHAQYIGEKLVQNEVHCSRQYTEGISILLGELARAVSTKCQARNIRITSIGIGIPGHWPWEVQDAYHKMVHQEFFRITPAIKMSDIHFLSETQAMTHYIFHLRLEVFRKRHDSNSKVIVLDFGGQNINISVYAVVYSESDGKPEALYEVCPPSGIVGGSEKHAELIGQYCEKICQNQGRSDQNLDRLQAFIDDFNQKKQFLDERHSTDVRNHRILRWEDYSVEVTSQVVREKFEEAFYEPLKKAESILEQFCPEPKTKKGWNRPRNQVGLKQGVTPRPRQEPKPCVVIAGGSSRYRPLRAKLQTLCAGLGISEPIFDQDLLGAPNFESHSIAQGAALATAMYMSVGDFMKRGAALGLQQLALPERGETEEDRKWENKAEVHYRGDLGQDVFPRDKVYVFNGGEELKIICSPLHSAGPGDPPTGIKYSTAYDIFALGRVNAGRASLTMDILNKSQGDATLYVFMAWWPPSSSVKKAPFSGSLSIPLRWDRPSCCVLVTDNTQDINWSLPSEAFSQAPVQDTKKSPRNRGMMLARRGGKKTWPGRGRPGGLQCSPCVIPSDGVVDLTDVPST